VSSEGRERRGESVIEVKKIDVNVNSTGILGIYGRNGAIDGKQAFLGVFSVRPGWSKRAVLSDMD